jgi:hypothetical protein
MVRARVVLLLAFSVAIAFSGASAQSLEATLREFGLLGSWAPDCAESPSPLHPRATYAVESTGRASISYELGPTASQSASVILSGERIGADELLLREEWLHDHSRLEVMLRKFRGKMKVWLSRESDGQILVREGTVVATGYVSPWMTHCSG